MTNMFSELDQFESNGGLLRELQKTIWNVTDEEFEEMVRFTYNEELSLYRRARKACRRFAKVDSAILPPNQDRIRKAFLREIIEKAFYFRLKWRLKETTSYFTQANYPSEITILELQENLKRILIFIDSLHNPRSIWERKQIISI